ncbi:MAG: protein kinase domain-containing protein [Jatrophihabitans sp.]
MRRSKVAQSDFFPGFTGIVEIGRGSLATVYRAREIATNRNVALKLLNVRDASPRAVGSFERESIALGAVSSHPNIVTLYRSFRAGDGRPVLVLELCIGPIGDRIRTGQGLPVPEVVSIGIKVAGALETAHRAEILHRDVKPHNILMTEYGEPALTDFGVAMLHSPTHTSARLLDFTTLNAAPELLEGDETSAATDIYGLVSSLCQLIAGRSASRAYGSESPASVIPRILRDPVQPLVIAQAPTRLSDLLIRAMSKDKDNRPPTAAQFAAELAEIEIDEDWPRTQCLIRDPSAPGGTVGLPQITRMPMLRPRNAPPVGLATPPPGQPPVPRSSLPPPLPRMQPTAAPDWSAPTLSEREDEGGDDPVDATPPSARHATPAATDPPAVPPETPRSAHPSPTGRHSAVEIDPDDDADRTVMRSSLQLPATPQLPAKPVVAPEAAEATVMRSSLQRPAAHQPPFAAPPSNSGGYRPLPLPLSSGEETVARSALALPQYPLPPSAAQRGEQNAGSASTWSSQPPRSSPWSYPPGSPSRPNQPQPHADLAIDPMSLRRRVTIRSGARALVIDEQRLVLRSWWRKTELGWSEVLGFEVGFESSGGGGHLVAMTRTGPVELPTTTRSSADLRYVQALLEAYRRRSNMPAR